VDSRSEIETKRGSQPRVSFGYDWARGSVLDLYRENVTRYRVMLLTEVDRDPLLELEAGRIPSLDALNLHNGTIWRWNRPCYGVTDGVPHLRIENRVLPAGPTIVDEVANAAFFYGLMLSLPERYGDPARHFSFSMARTNFINAARQGLDAHLAWIDGYPTDARSLILDELLPAAHEGLTRAEIPQAHRERYLGILEDRVRSGMTGSRWALEMLRGRRDRREAGRQLTLQILAQQDTEQPVHRWPLRSGRAKRPETLDEIMTPNLYTVRPEDVLDLATAMMEWQGIRHVPVEDEKGRVLGILSPRSWPRLLSRGVLEDRSVSAREVMDEQPPLLTPDTDIREGLRRLLDSDHHCVLVVEDDRVIGIVTERDFLRVLAKIVPDPGEDSAST
jgi:CBS domain-containing protein